MSVFIDRYFDETRAILEKIDKVSISRMIELLKDVRGRQGRLFIIGIGGSAANASHAVNDFRKIGGIETYSPCDNFAEFSAWANDSGWGTPFIEWLKESHCSAKDALMILSVGGGTPTTSPNIVSALEHARAVGATTLSLVSRDGGRSAQLCDCTILVPVVCPERITPHAEGMQSVLLHLVVNGLNG